VKGVAVESYSLADFRGLIPPWKPDGFRLGTTRAELGWALLLAQRAHRIYLARATCRHETREHRGND
jgi:hypothetical protein